MMATKGRNLQQEERRLAEYYRQLDNSERATLMRFAEFLASTAKPVAASIPMPEKIDRPAEESVVKAIKRLTATYPMLNPDKLLNQTSDLMAAHLIKGRAAAEIIDELELLFAEHYQQLRASLAQQLADAEALSNSA